MLFYKSDHFILKWLRLLGIICHFYFIQQMVATLAGFSVLSFQRTGHLVSHDISRRYKHSLCKNVPTWELFVSLGVHLTAIFAAPLNATILWPFRKGQLFALVGLYSWWREEHICWGMVFLEGPQKILCLMQLRCSREHSLPSYQGSRSQAVPEGGSVPYTSVPLSAWVVESLKVWE